MQAVAARRELVRLKALAAQREQEARLRDAKPISASEEEESSDDDEDDYTDSEDDMAPRLKPVFVRKSAFLSSYNKCIKCEYY